MTTFSQLVDDIITETRRPDLLATAVAYLNQTIREIHFAPDNNRALLYRENLREAQLTADVESGFGWNIPDPMLFQAMGTVRFDSINSRDDITRYPPEKTPGRGMSGLAMFYYRAGGRYFFQGYGGLGAILSIAYYEYPRRFKYYTVAQRPAQYDLDLGWTYAEPFDGSEELHLAAQGFVTNWVLLRWSDVIAEGLRAKIYKRLSDTDRARTAFSLYTQLRMGLSSSEGMSPGGFG